MSSSALNRVKLECYDNTNKNIKKDLNNHLAICLSEVYSFNAFNGTFRFAVIVNSISN